MRRLIELLKTVKQPFLYVLPVGLQKTVSCKPTSHFFHKSFVATTKQHNSASILRFSCSSHENISEIFVNDSIPDCSNGLDELSLHAERKYQMRNSKGEKLIITKCPEDNTVCIPVKQYCDGIPQCPDGGDEIIAGCTCEDWGLQSCQGNNHGQTNCINVITVYIFIDFERSTWSLTYLWFCDCLKCNDETRKNDKLETNNSPWVRDATKSPGKSTIFSSSIHLFYCHDFECPMHYKCPDSYCIPVRHSCDGRQDCPYGHDELSCSGRNVCTNMYWCPVEGLCLSPIDICDDRCHCNVTCDDERLCDKPTCLPQCQCIGYMIQCIGGNLTDMTDIHFSMNSIILQNNSIKKIAGLNDKIFLIILDLSFNKIESLETQSFEKTRLLRYVSLTLQAQVPICGWLMAIP